MSLDVNVEWQEEMTFDVEAEGHHQTIDADPAFGGRKLGPRPKPLLLASLAGCTGMDVISILKKMRVPVEKFNVSASGTLVEEHPKRFDTITVKYSFVGKDLPENKLKRAVQLSEESYCGVRASLSADIKVDSEIWLNGEKI
jgi:putative redox protein